MQFGQIYILGKSGMGNFTFWAILQFERSYILGDSGVGNSGVGDFRVGDFGVGDFGVGDFGVGYFGVGDFTPPPSIYTCKKRPVCLSVCLCRVWRPNYWMNLHQIWLGPPLDPADVIQKLF